MSDVFREQKGRSVTKTTERDVESGAIPHVQRTNKERSNIQPNDIHTVFFGRPSMIRFYMLKPFGNTLRDALVTLHSENHRSTHIGIRLDTIEKNYITVY
uniref:Uncharacterized protein n=1 Tax=Anopheles atroparvus TaxID=41427 RepID=A0AAG5D9V4_ANOAO